MADVQAAASVAHVVGAAIDKAIVSVPCVLTDDSPGLDTPREEVEALARTLRVARRQLEGGTRHRVDEGRDG